MKLLQAVEKIVHPKLKEDKNAAGKKPREIFSESHEEIVKAGEKWAKDTASSFTLVYHSRCIISLYIFHFSHDLYWDPHVTLC